MRQWLCCNCHFDDEEDGRDKEQSKVQSNKIDRTLLTLELCFSFLRAFFLSIHQKFPVFNMIQIVAGCTYR